MEITSEGRNGILVKEHRAEFCKSWDHRRKACRDLNQTIARWMARGNVWWAIGEHVNNFCDCIISRDKPASDVWTHVASINTHLSNIAIRLNRKIQWDAKSRRWLKTPERTKCWHATSDPDTRLNFSSSLKRRLFQIHLISMFTA